MGSTGSAGVESPDDADETSALIRSTGLLREPGDAVVGGDVASDAAGDVATSARAPRRGLEACHEGALRPRRVGKGPHVQHGQHGTRTSGTT